MLYLIYMLRLDTYFHIKKRHCSALTEKGESFVESIENTEIKNIQETETESKLTKI